MIILLTGGSGLLGQELQKLNDYCAPTSQQLDLSSQYSINAYFRRYKVDKIVHCAAYTKVEQAEINRSEVYNLNVTATQRLARYAPLLYISTEYVFPGKTGGYKEQDIPEPLNFYAKTKLWGEMVLDPAKDKIIRTLFKPRPWRYEKAYKDCFTSGDYVDIIAKEIDKAIGLFKYLPPIIHIGTGRKRILDLAKQTRADVGEMSRLDVKASIPFDSSLNTSWWEQIQELHN